MAKISKKRAKKKRAKKSAKKPAAKKVEKVTRIIHESQRDTKVEKALVDNFIALQKVMVNLSSKFDNLSTQISKLLELFEISAKALAQKEVESGEESGDTREIMGRLDSLHEKTGLIGKGLALMHETNRGQGNREMNEENQSPTPMSKLMDQRGMPQTGPRMPIPNQGLQRSGQVPRPLQKNPNSKFIPKPWHRNPELEKEREMP